MANWDAAINWGTSPGGMKTQGPESLQWKQFQQLPPAEQQRLIADYNSRNGGTTPTQPTGYRDTPAPGGQGGRRYITVKDSLGHPVLQPIDGGTPAPGGPGSRPSLKFGTSVGSPTGGGKFSVAKYPRPSPTPTTQPMTPTTPTTPTATPTSPGNAQVTTSITPKPIYTPEMTQQAINQARATAVQEANPYFQQKQFDRPGVSRSAGSMAAAMPSIADALASGNAAGTALSFADAAANAAHMLAGQSAQDQEGLGLQGINMSLAEMQQAYANSQKQQQQSLLLSLLNGLSGGLGGY